MSSGNVERLRKLYEQLARGDFRGPAELFSPDLVFEPVLDGVESFVGIDAFTKQMREFLGSWSDFRIEAQEFEDLGDAVLVTERHRGKGRRSGIEAERTFYAVWTFRDGVIVHGRWEFDRDSALAAAESG